jgi:hypothetical protein
MYTKVHQLTEESDIFNHCSRGNLDQSIVF